MYSVIVFSWTRCSSLRSLRNSDGLAPAVSSDAGGYENSAIFGRGISEMVSDRGVVSTVDYPRIVGFVSNDVVIDDLG